MKSLTWEWTAGFFQAEGSPTGFTNDSGKPRPILSIGQALTHSNILNEIQGFIESEYNYKPTLHPDKEDFVRLKINKTDIVALVAYKILPNLHSRKRQQMYGWFEKFSLPVFNVLEEPLNWESLTGFWEGDGGTSTSITGRERGYANTNFCIDFVQNSDVEFLDEIRTFLGKGAYPDKTHLRVADSKKEDLPIHRKLLDHARMQYRREQLVKQILLFEREKTSMSDEQTITRFRELVRVQ